MNDNVNHPAHYTDGKIEVIDFIEDKKLGFHLGNAVKYICRAGKKDPEKTIEKLLGVDIPDGIADKIVDGVKAQLTGDKLSGIVGKIKDLF